ncbi:MAG: VOC family protein [Planctomycetes bacterium]|nr:VOC family protein [Planctomycetota bacterium]
MPDIATVILYVREPLASARFYAGLLGREPVEASANFAMLPMAPGVMLGLWARHDVAPAANVPAGSGELAFVVADRDAVLATHRSWQARGIPIIQEPVMMDFGFTCTGTDPDGTRLRVMALSGP